VCEYQQECDVYGEQRFTDARVDKRRFGEEAEVHRPLVRKHAAEIEGALHIVPRQQRRRQEGQRQHSVVFVCRVAY
jgi:hypothetical protein